MLVVQGALWRALFWALYRPPTTTAADLPAAFLLGARFDLTVACYVFAIPLLAWTIDRWVDLIPPLRPARESVARLVKPLLAPSLIVLFAIVTFVSLVDVGYYAFYQDRLNVLVFGFIEDDTWALVKTMWKNYPVVGMTVGLTAIFAAQGWLIARETKRPSPPVRRRALAALLATGIFLVDGLGARGSLGLFPLSEIDTHVSSDDFVNLLSYNPVHAFSRAVQNKIASHSRWNGALADLGYGEDARRAWADCYGADVPDDPRALLKRRGPPNPWAAKTKPHVVLVVMESMGAYWFRYDREPFDLVGGLKPILAREPHIFTFLSATGATVGSLSSLMAGVPHRPSSDFLTEGNYLSTPVRTAPARVFKQAGYEARFVYAGNPGWRDIGKYARTQGFDTIEGNVEIEKALGRPLEHHDWGIYDADVFEHVTKRLETATRPQFVLIMTTANHPPYQLPEGAKEPKLEAPDELSKRFLGDPAVARRRLVTFRYSNDRLADFLNGLDRDGLGEKTVVGITGDHGFWIVPFSDAEALGRASVPFILKLPAAIRKPFPPGTYGGHADVWPTLYHLALDRAAYESAAVDLMDPKAPRYATNAGFLVLGAAGGAFVRKDAAASASYAWDGEALRPVATTASHEAMILRYRCLMGLLDDFFRLERSESRP